MSYRALPANILISMGRSIGRATGCELAVDLSEHSINASMQLPNRDTAAWDDNLYRSGCVFVDGYANPIKPRVRANKDLENPDTISHREGETDDTDEDDATLRDGWLSEA